MKISRALSTLAIASTLSVAVAAQAPKDAVFISDEDIKAVLKFAVDTHRTTPDNTIRVLDMGAYQLGVAVVHRGQFPAPAPPPAGSAAIVRG